MIDTIVTDKEVVAAYNAHYEAVVNFAPDRYELHDKAKRLAYLYACQKAAKNGLCVENKF